MPLNSFELFSLSLNTKSTVFHCFCVLGNFLKDAAVKSWSPSTAVWIAFGNEQIKELFVLNVNFAQKFVLNLSPA